jgi:hypothetical protein
MLRAVREDSKEMIHNRTIRGDLGRRRTPSDHLGIPETKHTLILDTYLSKACQNNKSSK